MRKQHDNEDSLGLALKRSDAFDADLDSGFRSSKDRWQIRHLRDIRSAKSDEQKARLIAEWIAREFDNYYVEFRQISSVSEDAFIERNFSRSVELSHRRLSVYSGSIRELADSLRIASPALFQQEGIWQSIENIYLELIDGRYEADLAFAYIHSVHRVIYRGEWIPVAYSVRASDSRRKTKDVAVHWTFPISDGISASDISAVLEALSFPELFRDVEADAVAVGELVKRRLADMGIDVRGVRALEMIAAGFYRNRGAYLVGRIVFDEARNIEPVPLILALENEESGIFVDAVLTDESHCHNIFSSTLANFHVTHMHYHELAQFLFELMPKRPLGLHYSTIGFNHIGKVAVINDLREEAISRGRKFTTAVGNRGTVAIGFAEAHSMYNLKVIRDKPTEQYKWGEFEGIESVLAKYRRVHEINRTGSMLDNIIYSNVKLEREYFEETLLAELLTDASESVSLLGNDVVFKHLIVQLRVTPLPVFLETATPEETEAAITNLGFCIKNNAAANVFNKDLDARNYGVSPYLKVYLFDYDALEPFVEVKIRTNVDQEEGEEDIPDWYFEDGVVFLPEEMEAGLMLSEKIERRIFSERHGDLMTVEFWQSMQNVLKDGRVPAITIYPESEKLYLAPRG